MTACPTPLPTRGLSLLQLLPAVVDSNVFALMVPVQQSSAAIGRIKKALDVAARNHDVETVRSLLNALVPYVMTEELLRQTGLCT